jgi:MoaD family protein
MFFGQFRDIAAAQESIVALKGGEPLSDLLEHLGNQYGASFRQLLEKTPGLRILINGREYGLLGGMGATLKERDTVVILPPVFGG